MKLDPRIEKDSLIYTPFSKSVINLNEHGYFAGEIVAFQDLKGCVYGELIERNLGSDCPYWCKSDSVCQYSFYIPESNLKPVEKKYRPYTLAEFIHNVGNVGDFVHYKHKINNHNEVLTVITEIRETNGFVVLGNLLISTERLLNEFEYYDNPSWYEYGTWKPFGVEE